MEELLDVVDEKDNVIKQATRSEVHKSSLRYRNVWVLVEDGDGKVLVQLRSLTKDSFPGCWDVSAAGHVEAGESYLSTANRELEEELGVKAKLTQIGYGRFIANDRGRLLDRFTKIYKCVVPRSTKFDLQQEEVSEVKWLEPQEILNLTKAHPDLIKVIKKYYL